MIITNKKILVTGGAGFLGSHLCTKLIEQGNDVTAIDNFYTGHASNIAKLFESDQFRIIKHDINKPINLDVDLIFNFACPASPPHYQKDPIFTTKTCFIGSMNMLELAKKNNARILQASTSEVYGDPDSHPQQELYRGNVNPIGIRSCYDEGKRAAESLFFDYHRMYQTQIKVIRIFNTYGPNMDPADGRVVSNFIMQALTNQPITIYGTGEQTRSFCYVDDLIEGIITMMGSSADFTGPVNLGNPTEFTLLQLAEKIISLTKSSSKISFKQLPEDDPRKRCPDITLAQEELNWKPKIDLDAGLIKTIEYFNAFPKKKYSQTHI